VVKWFGGYNSRKDRENDYGFIVPTEGKDLFVHKNEIRNEDKLSEGELVVFKIGERKGKQHAENVRRVSKDSSAAIIALQLFMESLLSLSQKELPTKVELYNYLIGVDDEFIALLKRETANLPDLLHAIRHILDDCDYYWPSFFKKIVGEASISELIRIGVRIDDMPSEYTDQQEGELFSYIKELDQNTRRVFLGEHVDSLPIYYIEDEKLSAYINEELIGYIEELEKHTRVSFLIDHHDDLPRNLVEDKAFISYENQEIFTYVKELDKHTRSAFLKKRINSLSEDLIEGDEFMSFLRQEGRKHPDIFHAIKGMYGWPKYFRKIVKEWSFDEVISCGMTVDELPKDYIEKHEEELFEYINGLDEVKRQIFLNENIDCLPSTVLLASEFKNPFMKEDFYKQNQYVMKRMISMLLGYEDKNARPIPEYVINTFHSSFNETRAKSSNSVIWQTIEPLLFKKHLFYKRPDLKEWFDQSLFVKSRIEFILLVNILPLIQAQNDLNTAYKVFLHRLWALLMAEEIDIKDKGVMNLFPSCRVMGGAFGRNELSCEAFYWPKGGNFLCRGKSCGNPQVLPDLNKHYLDFNIYDWFKHYGVNYSMEDEPSKRDFPIKLAGYINRLKEIFDRLHCRSCGALMKPDMRYARVEYIDIEDGKIVKKQMSAAYRVTVFHCGDGQCSEYENKYYINHCLGFGCGNIIDSRDAKTRCDNGLYICAECGSCCSQHDETNRIGLCPECGSNLNLFENRGDTDRYGKFARYVQCSNEGCEFEKTKKLPKKFYMKTCQPVRQVDHEPKSLKHEYHADDDIPF